MTPESKIKKAIREYLDSLAPRYLGVPYHNMGYGRRGVPDRIGCYRGVFIGLEIKKDEGAVADVWQRREIAAVIEAGGIAEVVWSVEQVKQIIARIDEGAE